jgi:hypothetical protein
VQGVAIAQDVEIAPNGLHRDAEHLGQRTDTHPALFLNDLLNEIVPPCFLRRHVRLHRFARVLGMKYHKTTLFYVALLHLNL